MKKKLKKAPLVYAQAQFHFTDLPSRQLGTEQELESLHKAMMDIGLADRIDSKVLEMGFHFNQEASKEGYYQVKQEENNMVRLIFRGFGNRRAVELLRNRLIIKTTEYTCYEDFKFFIDSILKVVEANITALGKVLTKQISLRYVDIVLPSYQYELKDYISPELLPFHPTFAMQTVGVSQSVAITGDNRAMVLVMEEIQPTPSGYPGRWLPADLMEPDNRASLTLIPMVDDYQAGKNYGILSIDHQVDVPTTPRWSQNEMLMRLDSLYDLSSKAFWEALTPVAEKEWGIVNE
jgi:uncharacterized protein (TIGR04255 family)